MNTRLFSFIGGTAGPWQVTAMQTLAGEPLALVERLAIADGLSVKTDATTYWQLNGITSNERYVTRAEKLALVGKQQGLGRPEARCAAFIPIRKNAAWWNMTQDERREMLEEQSRHIRIGMNYLPGVARRLHHCRDLGENEPFDFLTWFEFAPADAALFDDLTAELRASPEWAFVDREVEIRLILED
jgi:chlorite dismutase